MTIADQIHGTHKRHHYCLLNSIMAMLDNRVVSWSSGDTRPPNTINNTQWDDSCSEETECHIRLVTESGSSNCRMSFNFLNIYYVAILYHTFFHSLSSLLVKSYNQPSQMIPSPFFPPIITSSGPLSTHAAWPCLLAGQPTERATESPNLVQYCTVNKKAIDTLYK